MYLRVNNSIDLSFCLPLLIAENITERSCHDDSFSHASERVTKRTCGTWNTAIQSKQHKPTMFSLQRVKSATKVSPIVLRRLSRSQDNESSNTDLISTSSSIVRSSRLALSFAPSTSSDEEEETAQDGDIQVECLRKCHEFRFHMAACEGDIESLHSFLSEDTSDPDILDDRGLAALHHAARCNQVHAVNLLLDFGAKVDVRDESGKTPLFYAIR